MEKREFKEGERGRERERDTDRRADDGRQRNKERKKKRERTRHILCLSLSTAYRDRGLQTEMAVMSKLAPRQTGH